MQLAVAGGGRDNVLLKNDDFLVKNVEFLLKNDDFLVKNIEFLLKNDDFLLK